MLILSLLQISVLISLAVSIPALTKTLARLNEVRARALAQRANSARFQSHLHEKNRLKREIYEDFDERCHDEEDLDLYLKNARHHQHIHQHIHHTVVPPPPPPPPPPPAVFHGTHHSFVHPPPIHHQTIINQHQFANQFPGGGTINQAQAIHTIRKNADEDVSGQVFDPFDQRHEILQFLRDYEEHEGNPQKLRTVEDVGPRCSSSEEEFEFRANQPVDDNLQSLFIFRPQFYRNKRSLPLSRLITDPNVKLDIPKTMENFGTVTKHAFEDKHTPMYHMRNLIGSSKNTLLSAMRIPPQQLIVPSQYRIVKHNEELKNSNDENNNGINSQQFDETFKRVGKTMRETIQSGQDTIAHFNDMAHDARNVIYTSRHALPKLIIPYAQAPAVQRTRKPSAVLITPRIFDVAEKPLGAPNLSPQSDFVQLGHLMDAIGLSRPDRNKIAYQKIEFKPKTKTKSSILQATNQNLPKLLERLKDNNLESVSETVNALKEAKVSVGAKNLRDFLLRMKDELTNIVQQPSVLVKHEQIKPKKRIKHKKIEDKEMMRFVENLFNDIRILPKNDTTVVGLHLPPELEHPFMGRASKNDLKKFLESYNDQEQDEILQEFAHYLEHKDEISSNQREQSNILGAINPLMFERMYNESLKLEHNATENPKAIIGKPVDKVGTDQMLKPFMERLPEKKVQDFLDNFNEEQISDEIEED